MLDKTVSKKVHAEQFNRFVDRDLIPLKGHDKRPRDNGWTTQRYDAAKVVEKAVRTNSNVGYRIGADEVVLDIDPRNGGDESFKRLVADFGLDQYQWPRHDTGSGGFHHFLRLPPSVKIVGTLKEYPGVEFKTRGAQVVLPGSIHPTTGKLYRVNEFFPPLSEAPECPAKLLQAILRPLHDFKSSGGRIHSPAEVAAMLDGLDPADFSDEKKWRDLMMAVHHASGGDAREEFISWCWQDPEYDGDETVGLRWDSLHAERPGAITYKTLYKALRDAGRADLVLRPRPEDDFDDYEETGDPAADKQKKMDRFKRFKVSELLALPPPKWLVKSIMIEAGLFEIYGKFKSGKTFWAVEIACCVATGHDFCDVPVKQGKVVYIIAEGSRKLFAYRMDGWCKARAKDEDDLKRLRDLLEANIEVVPVVVHINKADQVKAFLAVDVSPCSLVVIDTLFRNFAGNVADQEAFSNFVAGCDMIRHVLKCAVLFLHHQKRNDAQGGFGSVVAEASVDAALMVSSPKKLETFLSLEIMRDGESDIPPWGATIKVEPIEGLSAEEVATVGTLQFMEREKSNARPGDILQLINNDKPASNAVIEAKTGLSKSTIIRRLKDLRAAGLVEPRKLQLTEKGLDRVAIDPEDDFQSDD